MNIDLHNMVDQLKAATYTLTADVSEATYGSASYYVTVYVDAMDGFLEKSLTGISVSQNDSG